MDTQSPLADRMRPQSLDEFVGQEHLVGEGKILRTIIAQDTIPSMIFWGPPGSGKTTLARIIANETDSEFIQISAVLAGVGDIRDVVKKAKILRHPEFTRLDSAKRVSGSGNLQQEILKPALPAGRQVQNDK